jgi:hypothetical protein
MRTAALLAVLIILTGAAEKISEPRGVNESEAQDIASDQAEQHTSDLNDSISDHDDRITTIEERLGL